MAALSPTARWRFLAETGASWAPILGAGVGVGALAGAGQLGLAYGLGLLHFWLPVGPDLTGGVWASQLTWVAWFAALAALAGAAGASWLALRQDERLAPGARIGVAVAGGVGAALMLPLTALPARDAELVGVAGQPVGDVLVASGLGLLLGVLAAVAVLSVRLVAVSVTLLVAVVWLLALVSAAPSLDPDAGLPDVRLAVLDLPVLGGARSTVAVLSAPVLALAVCGAVAAAARSRGFPPLMTAVSSAAAPGLLALTYLIGSPGTSDRAAQVSAYAGSLIALAAGLLVALLVGAVRLPSPGSPAADVGSDDAPTELIPPASATPTHDSYEPYRPSESFESFAPAEPPEPEPFEPPQATSSLFPEFRLPPLPEPDPVERVEPSWPPVEPAPGFATAADLFQPDEPEVPGEQEALTATSELPVAAELPAEAEPPAEAPGKPSRRLKLPKLRRKPKPPTEETAEPEPEPVEPELAEPEPAEPEAAEPEVLEPTSPAAPEVRPTADLPRPKRRREVEHVDWISSLADRSEEEEEPTKGRRRLRRDREAGSSAEPLPDVPTWPANDSPGA